MENNDNFTGIIDEEFNWENDSYNSEISDIISLNNKGSIISEDGIDDWVDFEFDYSEFELENSDISKNDNSSNKNVNIYNIDGYGTIYELDNYLDNANGVIELLQHAKSNEQFNYILGMSKEKAHDINLLNYLMSINYSIEDYVSIDVGYQIFRFKELVEYLLSKANNEQIKEILNKIAYVDESISAIVAKSNNRIELINSNYCLKDKIITDGIIQYFEENPDKIDLEVVNVCYLDTEQIKKFISLGYKISDDSPYDILKNNDIMREEFLKLVKIEDVEILNKLDNELRAIPRSYGMLYESKTKEIFKKEFVETFGKLALEQMIKYIVLGDYQIDLSKINADNIKIIKNIYDSLACDDLFDIQLFAKIIYKFNLNPNIFINFNNFNIDKSKLKLYFEFKELIIGDISELNNLQEILFNYENSKIELFNNVIDLKNVICNLLINQTYFETKKTLIEMANKEKLSVLKNSIKDEKLKKELDSFIILSDFLGEIDNINDVVQLKEIANILNKQILKNGVNYNWLDFNKKIINFYSAEMNERMTDFNKYMVNTFYDASDFKFNDGTNVSGKRVKVAHIKSGEEFNSLIHVLNAYQNGVTTGSIESILNPKFIGQSYICLTGISDEYSRICINHNSKYSIKVLYSNISNNSMFCASNRDTGIIAKANSKNISTKLPSNMAPFRRLVRNTETHGSETYNEIDVFRDNLIPSGIAFMYDKPTQEEINAAAYLGVPLVKIDDLQESFRKDLYSVLNFGLGYNQDFYHIKEHEYENQEVIVSLNDKYDVMINTIKEKIHKQYEKSSSLNVFNEKNEIGYDERFVIYNDEKYSVIPVYEYVDSKRENIQVDYYEKCLIKDKLYSFLNIKPRTTFINCKYQNGDEILSVINNTNEPRLIDKYIDYLVDVPNFKNIFNDLSNYSVNSVDELNLLNKVNSLDNNAYVNLFESLIKVNDYVEPNIMLNEIISKKERLSVILSKYNEQLNELQASSNLEVLDIFETESNYNK